MQWQEFRSHIRHLPTKDLHKIEKAFTLGKRLHDGQKRKSGEPYFQHPIAVAHMLADLGADADTLVAALLHDTVEDTPITLAEIDREFGGSVATLIDGVTKLEAKDIGARPNLDEQIETLRKIFTLMQQDVRIMVIKLIDRLHNMQTVEFLAPERQRLLAQETQEVYVKIADKLCMQDLRDELEGLCLSVLEPDSYPRLAELRATNEQRGAGIVDGIRATLTSFNRLLAARTTMLFEYKSWRQLESQLTMGNTVVTGISFLTTVFVCEDIDSCYRIMGALHQLWKREILSFQDFINAPQLNGYQGLHTTIIDQDGMRIRCKIRTKEMHTYARQGVASVCFTASSNIGEILPWTTHISPLSTDTEGSSNDFWLNLKSDILGDSIMIHGPDDSILQLPKGSTALDGAFYLFQDRALGTQSLSINGVVAPFSMALENGASLNIVFSEHNTCSREWLRWVQTGFATAKIRSVLVRQSENKKFEIGRQILQQTFTERKRGYIEEFDEAAFSRQLKELGYESLNAVYTAIADGRLEPSTVYTALFQPPKRRHSEVLPASLVRYAFVMDGAETMDRVNLIHRKYGSSLSDIRYHRATNGMCTVSLRVRMSPEELGLLREDLMLAGAMELTILDNSTLTVSLIVAIIVLWGLDPVVAHQILASTAVSPVDLTVIRFVMFFLASSVTYAVNVVITPVKSKPIWPFKSSLILSGVALFLTAILSYVTLSHVPASQYILFIISGLVATKILEQLLEGSVPLLQLLATAAIGAAMCTVIGIQGFSPIGTLAGFGSALGFAIYSQLSKRYQETEAHIHARYPAFVFWLSVITILMTFSIIMFSHRLDALSALAIIKASLFALIFCFLPYVLYFECLRKTDATILERLLPFVCIATIIGELATTKSASAFAAVPFLAIFLWAYYPRKKAE